MSDSGLDTVQEVQNIIPAEQQGQGGGEEVENSEDAIPPSTEDEDGWSDFAEVQQLPDVQEPENGPIVESGQISTNIVVSAKESEEEVGMVIEENDWEDDFADFQEATPAEDGKVFHENNLASNNGSTAATIPLKSVQQLITGAFSAINGDKEIYEDAIIDYELGLSKKGTSNTAAHAVWTCLRNREEASTLKFKWPTSHAFGKFLDSLKIDPRNILQTNVPKFAAGLGMLEPVRSSTPVSGREGSKTAPLDKSSSDGSNYPNADFDWQTSGLTNPLNVHDEGVATNDIDLSMDLNYFAERKTGPAPPRRSDKKSFSLEEELLTNHSIRSSTKDAYCVQDDVIANLLASAYSTSLSVTKSLLQPLSPVLKAIREESSVSSEAQLILTELPNLSFMRSSSLDFPNQQKNQVQTGQTKVAAI